MLRNEAQTDLWVYTLLTEAGINLDYQGSGILEVNEALKTASKSGTGRVGYPEFVGVVKDFLIVIENKADISKHIMVDKGDIISFEIPHIRNYALNGALFYAKHLVDNTTYKKVIAIGVSGDEKKHRITPIFVDETDYYRVLPDVKSFISFNESNIDEYYTSEILHEKTDNEKETVEILKDAAILHEDLRNYGNLKDVDKPLIVSGILLALREMEFKNFSIDDLTGDNVKTDGRKIFDAIESNLTRSNVSPVVKKDKILSQFSLIKDTKIINESNPRLGKTPLRHYTEFLHERIYTSIKYNNSSEDYLGRFYGEFMSYSGGDGQTLGIVLTPRHITDLFCELVDIKPYDVVLDPTCGTGGFLVAAMHHMLEQAESESERRNIRQNQLHGVELQSYMFTIATTNMILRGDGKSNLINEDFLAQNPHQLQLLQPTVGMMNPPYSMGSKDDPALYELAFTEHMLNSLTPGARGVVIIQVSSLTNKTNEEKALKANILKNHTLEGVITLNRDTFYNVGTSPCIVVFTAGEPHPEDKEAKFINFEDDGFEVAAHVGLVETERAKDRKQHLLDVWFDRLEAETAFSVETKVEAEDEWLHSYFYFNDDLPSVQEFRRTVGNHLAFEFYMVMNDMNHLLDENDLDSEEDIQVVDLEDKDWAAFMLTDLFSSIQRGKRLTKKNQVEGSVPYVSSTALNNGVDNFIGNDEGVRRFDNCLTIANSGSIGSTFYHPYEFIASDHVTHLKNSDMNKYVYLFVATMLNRLAEKYGFNREMSDTRIKRERVMLPIDEEGKPDFLYMENYIKKIMIEKYERFISTRIQRD